MSGCSFKDFGPVRLVPGVAVSSYRRCQKIWARAGTVARRCVGGRPRVGDDEKNPSSPATGATLVSGAPFLLCRAP